MPRIDKHSWLLCYDIAEPKRLSKIHRYVTKIAIPMQYSVFLMQASHTELDEILDTLKVLINEKEDDIRIYPLHKKPKKYTIGEGIFTEGIMLFDSEGNRLD